MQRNPYLILGVPFGTGRDEARRRFAMAARRLRRHADGPYSVEDLTWALHEIETLEGRPDDAVDYFRVPANPAVFASEAPGLFRPPARPMSRRTVPQDRTALEALRRAASVEVLGAVLSTFSSEVVVDLAFDPPGELA